ncbi:MAG: leucine-rich repeat domain-containing protein [Candidatus Aminicenantes bacterium]
MTSDRELIKQLEKEIGRELYEREFENIHNFGERGFAIGENGEVVGLNLDEIELDPVPASLSKFHHLKKLSLLSTGITDISFLQGLSNLTYLYLMNNQIKELPEALVELGLEIDVDDNNGWDEQIYLANNPLEKPPLEIIRKGKKAIRAYFES